MRYFTPSGTHPSPFLIVNHRCRRRRCGVGVVVGVVITTRTLLHFDDITPFICHVSAAAVSISTTARSTTAEIGGGGGGGFGNFGVRIR